MIIIIIIYVIIADCDKIYLSQSINYTVNSNELKQN